MDKNVENVAVEQELFRERRQTLASLARLASLGFRRVHRGQGRSRCGRCLYNTNGTSSIVGDRKGVAVDIHLEDELPPLHQPGDIMFTLNKFHIAED